MERYSKDRLIKLIKIVCLMTVATAVAYNLFPLGLPFSAYFGFMTIVALCPVLRKVKLYIPLALLCSWQPVFLSVIGYLSVCWFALSIILVLLYEAAPDLWKERHFSPDCITRFMPDVYRFTHIEFADDDNECNESDV